MESVRQMADLARFMVDMDYLSFLAKPAEALRVWDRT
jgi:hypothetical protein